MISSIINWLVDLISRIGYPGVGIAMFLESFFAPIPSEVILPFSGFVAFNGTLNIYLVIIVASISAYLGSLPFYVIGRWGNSAVIKFAEKYGKYFFISEEDIEKGFEVFDRYGNGIVFFGRLIPIVRTVISFPAGVAKMRFDLFSLYTIAGATIWSAILASAGFFLGEKWNVVSELISKYENAVLVVLVILFVLYIGWNIRKVLNRSN
ncbi:DedA family protein [Candidatus Microgenomates bacterium]|jgi:membrane protein DedA with SNARE-associated domain|nr:DedA family protein [Candidatus Microgenomates bacterium]